MADDSIGGLDAALQGAFAADGGAGLRRLLAVLRGRAARTADDVRRQLLAVERAVEPPV
jgi:hypothetical protein